VEHRHTGGLGGGRYEKIGQWNLAVVQCAAPGERRENLFGSLPFALGYRELRECVQLGSSRRELVFVSRDKKELVPHGTARCDLAFIKRNGERLGRRRISVELRPRTRVGELHC